MGMTITAGTTFYITNATATATTASAAPTYNAFTVYRLPCPNNTTLTCCDPNQENNTPTQSGCIAPFNNIVDPAYDSCPISFGPGKNGECCQTINTDGSATGCQYADALYDTTYPPMPN
ncbi:hypothetical protein MMC28_009343 [Mycoblastus sanguinarius]|nr:hypothetical protein [Mycoblastus sanguinarius]